MVPIALRLVIEGRALVVMLIPADERVEPITGRRSDMRSPVTCHPTP